MTTSPLPSVAVIMTAYNAASTIESSLRSALDQDYDGDWRIFVVDDGSSDGTSDVIRSLRSDRITVVQSARVGRARALNLALLEAAGYELASNLDADDYMLPGRLRAQAARFSCDPKLGVVGSAYLELHVAPTGAVQSAFLVSPPTSDSALRTEFAASFPICHSCATYRRSEAIQIGGFDFRRRARLDFDLWLRLARTGYRVENVSDTLGVHVKRSGTYFDSQFGRLRSAAQMARLNYLAVLHLDLGPSGILRASARLAYSLLRRRSVKSFPRFAVRLDLPRSAVAGVAATLETLRASDTLPFRLPCPPK